MSTNTPILNIPEVASNQNQKEVTINTGIAILEASANDTLPIDMSTADHALTVDEYTQNFVFTLTGNTAARNLDTPLPAGTFLGKRTFVVSNTGTADVTVRPGGLGTGNVTVTAGEAALLSCDGSAVTTLSSGAAPVSGASFITLGDVPASYSGHGLTGVRVKSTTDGLEFYTILNDMSFMISGKPGASQILNYPITQSMQIAINAAGTQCYIGTLPTATLVVTIKKISGGTTTTLGTISFATSGVATIAMASATSFAPGDVLQLLAPASQDATGADVGITIKATLL